MPTISVILPTHNRAQLLQRAIRSILGQTYQDFELIIVDDCSYDNTEDIVKNFNDNRIIYVKHSENKGGSAARNTGIHMASGTFISFLDDDDEYLPEKFEKQIKKFQEVSKDVGLVYCGTERVDVKGKVPNKKFYPKEKGDVKDRLLLGPMVCGLNSVFIKKECFNHVGLFDEDLKSCQDWDMWKRISEYYEFDFVNEILTKMYLHDNQISSDIDAVIQGRKTILKKYEEEIRAKPKILVMHLKMLGKLYSSKRDWEEATRYFKEAVSLDIFQIFKIALWLIIELPKEKLYSPSRAKTDGSLPDLKTARIENAYDHLNITTYHNLDQIVHSKVLYFENGWNNYKFWIALTPLPYIPIIDESKENPCIMASHDGENWITPSGLINPLDFSKNEGCQFFSDTHLVCVNDKLEIWYRAYNPEKIYKKTSVDGINWSERIEVMEGKGESLICPTVIYDENKYKLWVIEKVEDVVVKYVLAYYESDNGLNFKKIRNIQLSNTKIGHHDIIRTEYGYECMFHERGDKKIFYTRSKDNISWETCIEKMKVVKGTWNDTKLYRPNLTVVGNSYYIYYTGGLSNQGPKIGLIKI